MRPRNRFTRFEYGLNANNVSRSIVVVRRLIDYSTGYASDFITDDVQNLGSFSYVAPYAAFVSDNTLFGYTAPISGRRFRFQVEPSVGNLQWTEFTATIAGMCRSLQLLTRVAHAGQHRGRKDENQFRNTSDA
jgi:hypothetical protein